MSRKKTLRPGDRFGHLTLVSELPRHERMRAWRLRCDCGSVIECLQKNFTSGGKKVSCGCMNRKGPPTHGNSTVAEYRAWINMKSRCLNPNTPGWDNYGGRGIAVCDRWAASFEDFLADVGRRPSPKHSLDRWPDPNGDYGPTNCRWATPTEQMRNLRTNHKVVVGGSEMTLAEAVEQAPVPYNTVLYRLKRGWPIDEAISRTARKGQRL